jgi:hypothetical protein
MDLRCGYVVDTDNVRAMSPSNQNRYMQFRGVYEALHRNVVMKVAKYNRIERYFVGFTFLGILMMATVMHFCEII